MKHQYLSDEVTSYIQSTVSGKVFCTACSITMYSRGAMVERHFSPKKLIVKFLVCTMCSDKVGGYVLKWPKASYLPCLLWCSLNKLIPSSNTAFTAPGNGALKSTKNRITSLELSHLIMISFFLRTIWKAVFCLENKWTEHFLFLGTSGKNNSRKSPTYLASGEAF